MLTNNENFRKSNGQVLRLVIEATGAIVTGAQGVREIYGCSANISLVASAFQRIGALSFGVSCIISACKNTASTHALVNAYVGTVAAVTYLLGEVAESFSPVASATVCTIRGAAVGTIALTVCSELTRFLVQELTSTEDQHVNDANAGKMKAE